MQELRDEGQRLPLGFIPTFSERNGGSLFRANRSSRPIVSKSKYIVLSLLLGILLYIFQFGRKNEAFAVEKARKRLNDVLFQS